MGNLGGFVGSYLLGLSKDTTGSYTAAPAVMAIGAFVAAGIGLAVGKSSRPYGHA